MKRLFLAALALAALGAVQARRVPWPGGAPPDAVAMTRMRDLAARRWEQERILEFDGALQDALEFAMASVDQREIDEGHFDLETTDFYGRRLFQQAWRRDLGLGAAGHDGRLRPVHDGDKPGLDSQSCEACHSAGGRDGGGTFTQNALLRGDGDSASSALPRNPPPLLGAGLVQALAAEMTAELQGQRAAALARAEAEGEPVTGQLTAKGVSFGALTAHPDGAVDTAALRGVDPDLVVKPFGWKGEVATLRRFAEEAARVHLGIQSHSLVLRQPDPAQGEDPDGDGVSRELEEGSLTSLAIYLELLETPVIVPPVDPALQARWSQGDRLFDSVGCASCHTRVLRLEDRTWEEAPPGSPPVRVHLLADGDTPRGTDQVQLFSDLKRHDMGPELADKEAYLPGVSAGAFLTRPLWGLAESAPYLHTGQAATIPAAILAHGGEAQAARDAYAALPPQQQASLHVFLLSLSRQPTVRMAR